MSTFQKPHFQPGKNVELYHIGQSVIHLHIGCSSGVGTSAQISTCLIHLPFQPFGFAAVRISLCHFRLAAL
jgi:hypothetical protein